MSADRHPGDAATDAASRAAVHRVSTGLRVPAFTAATAGLALLAHLLGGGSAPGGTALGLGIGIAVLQSLALAVRERGAVLLAAHVLAAQGVLHVVWEPGTGHGALPPAHGWHSASGSVGAVTWPSGWMLIAHLVAALLVAAWLRRGEAAVWRCVRRVLAAVPATPGEALVPAPVRLLPVRRCPAPGLPGVHHRPVPRRGPPVTV